jgi:hypothetical protein
VDFEELEELQGTLRVNTPASILLFKKSMSPCEHPHCFPEKKKTKLYHRCC